MAAKPNALLTLTITHLEKQKIVFAVERIPVGNEFSMKFQFPDGAEYRVVALAKVPGKSPIRNEQVIAVTGIEPPAKATVPALAYFVGLIALGLGAGRWSKRRARSCLSSSFCHNIQLRPKKRASVIETNALF